MRFFNTFSGFVYAMAGLLLAGPVSSTLAQSTSTGSQEKIWRFDRTDMIGGHKTQILGHPTVIDTPYGKAVEFSGNGDAILAPEHPLAGAKAFTWDVIFRPDAGGAQAQRFFHLAEQDQTTGLDTENRLLFEIRIVDGQWCLDSFAGNRGKRLALLNCKALHPLGKWYRVTAVWDGKTLKNYVNDELQGEGALEMPPEGPGRSSIGMRLTGTYPFKGAVLVARMTPRALPPDEFLKMPPEISRGK
jgi:hypothetical protein